MNSNVIIRTTVIDAFFFQFLAHLQRIRDVFIILYLSYARCFFRTGINPENIKRLKGLEKKYIDFKDSYKCFCLFAAIMIFTAAYAFFFLAVFADPNRFIYLSSFFMLADIYGGLFYFLAMYRLKYAICFHAGKINS
jgi:hypothetical protein